MADPAAITTPPGVTATPAASPGANGTAEGHKPYVPDSAVLPEFTWQAVVVGALLGILFGASSLYLVLRVGMTVSASIPVAVLSITLFRALSRAFGLRGATILENNITQTAGSAGESIAFGVGVTMPALMLLGFDMDLTRVMVVSVLGGLLGILMMIPLRRAFIVKMHGKPGQPNTLLYPEGTACAEVLISGEKGGTSASTVFIGFGVAFAVKFLLEGMSMMASLLAVPLKFFNRVAQLSTEVAPELIGVGFVIGVRVACVMMAGAVIGNLVIVPAIATFGDQAATVIAPGTKPIAEMSLGEIQGNYLRFIGAGCVTAAGIISMFRTLPMILRSFRSSLGSLRGGRGKETGGGRTDRDMSPRVVLLGSLVLLGLLAAFLTRELTAAGDSGAWWKAILGAALVLVFGFLFVTVSSRLTGEIGSSSNPISGMTVATLALTCLIFLVLGMTSPVESVIALSIGGVVCIAASNGGTTSQDLKTGYLVGGTPVYQQYAILIGALSSALVIGVILLVFNQAGTVYTAQVPTYRVPASQAAELKEPVTYNKKDYRVWKVGAGAEVPAGTYYLAGDNSIAFRLGENGEPTDKGLPPYVLSPDEYKKLTRPVSHDGKSYLVWWPRTGDPSGVPSGKYYVDPDRKLALLEDPAITGKVKKRDNGDEVKMKFEAPKTAVIGIIINGVLEQRLNWGLVLIGAMLAVGLELCGVGSLAFAVGVYIPMQYTTPIFLGGLVRWIVDRSSAPSSEGKDEASAIAESETGPGVLLSSGYIAGGTIAGVIIAFLELPFFEVVKNFLNFSRKVGEENLPRFVYQGWGMDLAPVPVLLALLAFLVLVGMGKLLKPSRSSG